MYINVHVCTCTCMYMYVHVCTCMYMYVHACTCMYVYVRVCTCMYVYLQMTLIVNNPPCRYLLAGYTWEKIWTNKTRTPCLSLIIAYRINWKNILGPHDRVVEA